MTVKGENQEKRVIKFRGQTITGEWDYGSLLIDTLRNRTFIVEAAFYTDDKTIVHIARYEVLPETVGQFTGLHDKNGVEIFEGDVITYDLAEGLDEPEKKGLKRVVQISPRGGAFGHWDTNIKVIGNIYQNSELL